MTIAVSAIVVAETALQWTVDYTRERKAFGQSIGEFQNTRFKLAELSAEILAKRVFVDRCIELLLEKKLDAVDAAAAKMLCTELQCKHGRRLPAVLRRLRLHARVPHRTGLHRLARAPHRRRFVGDHARDHRAPAVLGAEAVSAGEGREPLRSMLFVPGDSERKLAKAAESPADALILDLEDSVARQPHRRRP